MVPRLISHYGPPVIILTAAVILAALIYIHPTVGATMSDTVAAAVSENVQLAVKHTNRIIDVLLPHNARPFVQQFLAGFTAPALFAQGLRAIPGTTNMNMNNNNNNMNMRWADIMAFPVEKFFYALGGIMAELLLLHLLVHPRRTPPFASSSSSSSNLNINNNNKINKKNKNKSSVSSALCAFFTTHIGWWLLLLVIAIPNGVVEAGVVISIVAQLPAETYAPAVVAGKLLQPYIAAAAQVMHIIPQSWAFKQLKEEKELLKEKGILLKEKGILLKEEWMRSFVEVALWGAVVLTVFLFLARCVCEEPCVSETDLIMDGVDSESESDEE